MILKRKPRAIKLKLIGLSGLFYRIHIIIIQSIFWYIFYGLTTHVWAWEWAISSSILWNIFNTILYYNWHVNFARYFRVGKEKE